MSKDVVERVSRHLPGIFVAIALLAGSPGSWAAEMPGGPEASPDIYRIIAQNDLSRLVLITWQPGQRDNWHGHPPTTVFYLTDCLVRVFFPDGSQRDLKRKAGTGRVRAQPVISHSVQNIGTDVCQILHTEIKSR